MSDPKASPIYPYAMQKWGEGYFSVNVLGQLCVQANSASSPLVLDDIVDACHQADLHLPLLIRFDDILQDRLQRLNAAFAQAADENNYSGQYQAVYPIKVNQQRAVVEQLMQTQGGSLGLEAGSKPELLAVLALSTSQSRTIVCNGYKDASYIEAALLGQKLGFTVYLVVEKLSELSLIIKIAQRLQVQPHIGLRVRLRSIGKGNWQNTGGSKSKFGLDAQQLQQAIDALQAEGAIDSLNMLHVHLGSQIANLRDVKTGLKEVARYFAEIKLQAPALDTIDVGGGLGVDYDGTGSRGYYSMNYSIEDYAQAIVHCFATMASHCDIEAPHIISESGRALTAHHAVLIANIIDSETPTVSEISDGVIEDRTIASQPLLAALAKEYRSLDTPQSARALVEVFHECDQLVSELQDAFVEGELDLQAKRQADALHRQIQQRLLTALDPAQREHRKLLRELESQLATKLFVNFSVFQSVPDVWGINQVFPITPTRHLNEHDLAHAVIQDITCDSDGRIDDYVTTTGIESTLPIPQVAVDTHAPLCFFMVGAYQEILGDMHNLFGDTDAVSVSIDSGALNISAIERGDTLSEVLDYVHLDKDFIEKRLKQSVQESGLDAQEQADIQSILINTLSQSTYLKDSSD